MCEWGANPSEVNAILKASAAGEPLPDVADRFDVSLHRLERIVTAHEEAPEEAEEQVQEEAHDRRAPHGPAVTPTNCGEHACQWAGVPALVEGILDGHAKGTTVDELAERFDVAPTMIVQVITAHSAPNSPDAGAPACGQHVCLWAEQPALVEGIIAAYRRGDSVRRIAEHYPHSRDTITRILDAHGVVRRSRSEQCVRVPIDLDEVDRRYRQKTGSLYSLAAECGLSRQALTRRLVRYRAEKEKASEAST